MTNRSNSMLSNDICFEVLQLHSGKERKVSKSKLLNVTVVQIEYDREKVKVNDTLNISWRTTFDERTKNVKRKRNK